MRVESYLVLNNQEARDLGAGVVVEGWDKRMFGRVKRLWLAEFTEADRLKAAKVHRLCWDWIMVRGVPQEFKVKPDQLEFIQRVINFFASI